MNGRIRRVRAWEALDSRGRPTVAARVELADGSAGTAIAPSGASAGAHEARELRDGGARRSGLGVRQAVQNVHDRIAPAIVGLDAWRPSDVDDVIAELDGTADFSVLGANATLAVSLATALAAAKHAGTELVRWLRPRGPLLLPMPMVNIVSGGAHAAGAIDIQDVLVVPCRARSFAEAIQWCCEVRDAASMLAVERRAPGAALVADEGGIGIPFASNEDALRFTVDAIRRSGHEPGTDIALAIDVAASQFFDGERYRFRAEARSLSARQLVAEIAGWRRRYPIVSIEDLLAEDAWDDWAAAHDVLGDDVQLVGDDHFVTNAQRLERGIRSRSANSILIKVNQNGLLSHTHRVLEAARASGFSTVVSARSGETEQSWLADLAVGWGAGQIKVGSTHRSERTAKWNRLLELEATEDTVFAGSPELNGLPADTVRGVADDD